MKTLIFCADGTWNGPNGDIDGDNLPDATNVFKLFCCLPGNNVEASLRLQNEQERFDASTRTLAKYLHGVGDSNNPLVKALGGAFGSGVTARIIRGYTFLSRNYKEDDKIILVGFSRGAYTVRALAGFIAACGLLDATEVDLSDKMKAYVAAVGAWHQYRKQAKGDGIKDIFDWFPSIFSLFQGVQTTGKGSAPIEAVAVWDTVGAHGIPLYIQDKDERYNYFQFADCKLSPTVKHGIHAVAADEERTDFGPTLWEPRNGVTQMLFAGAHADVGGGYNTKNQESDLSNIALEWMLNELDGLGVAFAPDCRQTWGLLPPNPLGPSHQPWTEGIWQKLGHTRRVFPEGVLLEAPSREQRKGKTVLLLPSGSSAIYT
jgi:uncharacterized protein (DUF2235 family)